MCVDTESPEGAERYFCYWKDHCPRAGVGRFLAISLSYAARAVLISADSLDNAIWMDSSDLSEHSARAPTYIFRYDGRTFGRPTQLAVRSYGGGCR